MKISREELTETHYGVSTEELLDHWNVVANPPVRQNENRRYP